MRTRIFRWRAISVLLLVLAVLGLLTVLFAEPVLEETTEEAGTELLGTQLDIGSLDLRPGETAVDLGRLELADPFDPMKNLVEAEAIAVRLNPEALAEKKLVIERLTLRGMRFGTRRTRPAEPPRGDGFAPTLLREVRSWARQFDVPVLQLTTIDTVRQLALDPAQLGTIREARALAARADSTRRALQSGFQALDIEGTVDSARALADRLAKADPARLGLEGTRRAVEDVRRTLDRIEEAKRRVEGLERSVREGVDLLGAGLGDVDAARRRDYAFARSLIQLPSLDAPDISGAFFGQVSIDRFKEARYWAELARQHMPPGLLPKPEPGPDRLRASGTTVTFPKRRDYPPFLLRDADVDFTIAGEGPLGGAYTLRASGVTTYPALYGRPAVLRLTRSAEGSAVASLRVDAVLNHLTRRLRDSLHAVASGVSLPAFDIPRLPFRVDPGRGRVMLDFAMTGERVSGRWSIAADRVAWRVDSAGRALSQLEELVWRVVSGLERLEVTAELRGTLAKPQLAVRSNIDEAIAARIKALFGEAVASAERRVRAEVDRLVEAQVAPVRREVDGLRAEATRRVAEQRRRLDELEARLQARLKALTGGLVPGLPLPKLEL